MAILQYRCRLRFSRKLLLQFKLKRGSCGGGLPRGVSEMRFLGCGLFPALILAFFQSIAAHAVTAPGPDAFGYSVATTAFSFIDITNGAHVLYFADDEAVSVNIGFNFNFYGVNYKSLSFNPNGLITFGGPSRDFNNVDLTTSVAPSNNLPCIAVLWDDWETQALGADGLYYVTTGTLGSRQFIVQWNKVAPVNGTGTNTVTFQARLLEGSNQILLSYLDVDVSDDPSYGNGAFATVGIRDRDGQINNRNLLWSHNQAVVTNGESILFTRTNHPPIAAADVIATLEGTPIVVNVIANDSDPDGNHLMITSVTQGANGSVTINGGTNVTYRPNTGFKGADTFAYTIADGQGGFATNSVSVNVWPFEAMSISGSAGGGVSVQFSGIPLRTYYIQTSSNLVDWTTVAPRTADTNGGFSFEQTSTALPPAVFFRAVTSWP
jgi:Bacterial Ig domain